MELLFRILTSLTIGMIANFLAISLIPIFEKEEKESNILATNNMVVGLNKKFKILLTTREIFVIIGGFYQHLIL